MSYKVTAKKPPKLTLNEGDTVASALQNIALILTTFKGACPLYREFGLSRRSIDKPVEVAKAMLVIDVREAIMEFEPRAEVINITFEIDPKKPGRVIPTVEVNIIHE